jgi:hypothetical protein
MLSLELQILLHHGGVLGRGIAQNAIGKLDFLCPEILRYLKILYQQFA